MNPYEELLVKIHPEIPVLETNLVAMTGYPGLYRNNRIYLDSELSLRKKRAYLAEEYGHHKRSVGTIVNYKDAKSRKEEWRARRYGIEMLITLDDLLECGLSGYHTKYDCADFLDVPVEFLSEALIHYYNKFGTHHVYKNYLFIFNEESIWIDFCQKLKCK